MRTLDESLPPDVIKSLSLVEQETGLSRDEILGAEGVHYRAMTDSVARNPHPDREGRWVRSRENPSLWRRITGRGK